MNPNPTRVGPDGPDAVRPPVDRAASPDVATLLASIDRRLAALEGAVAKVDEAASQAPSMIAAMGDAFDDHVGRLADQGIDVDARAIDALKLLERLSAPGTVRALNVLLDQLDAVAELAGAGALDPAPRSVLHRAARAFASAAVERTAQVGAFGAFRALGDPDVQRALGFVLEVARGLGRGLAAPAALPAPTNTPGANR